MMLVTRGGGRGRWKGGKKAQTFIIRETSSREVMHSIVIIVTPLYNI